MVRAIAKSWEGWASRRLSKKVEMLFAHLERIFRLGRLRLRGPNGAHDEFILAATAQNLRKLAKLVPMPQRRRFALLSQPPRSQLLQRNGHKQTSDVRLQGSSEIARRRAYNSAEGLGESGRRRISGCERNFTDR